MLGRQRVRESLLRRGGGGREGIPPELARGVGGFGWRRGGGGAERGAGWVATVVRQCCPSPAAEKGGREGRRKRV